PGTSWGTCTSATSICGDPNGCVASSFSGNQIACFAVRTCTLTSGGDLGTCNSYGAWGLRPLDTGNAHGLQVKVVIKFPSVTPALGQIAGSGGILYLTQSSVGEELYF